MKKTAVIAIVLFVLTAHGCAKTEPQISASESPALQSAESSAPASDMQTQDITVPETLEIPDPPPMITETTMLINELDNGEKGLFYLGMTKDEVVSILEYNNINYQSGGISGGIYYWISFDLFNNEFRQTFLGQNLPLVEILIFGHNPVKATSTQLGLNLDDPFEKMVELYGDDYTVPDADYPYQYRYGDYYFRATFHDEYVTAWGIWSECLEYRQLGERARSECLKYMFGGINPSDFIETLGEPESKRVIHDVERWYFKQGVEIDVICISDTWFEIANYIYISDQCELKTDRGIGIGSTYEEVLQAYKDAISPFHEYDEPEAQIIIGRGDIYFIIKGNKVSSIYIPGESFTSWYFGDFTPDRP